MKMNKLLDILFKNSSLSKQEIKKEDFSFSKNGIKYHYLNVDGVLETLEVPSNRYYLADYTIIENIWRVINIEEAFDFLKKSIQSGRVIIYDYDNNKFGVEKREEKTDYSYVIASDLSSIKEAYKNEDTDPYLHFKYEQSKF